jgi:hypothetical protein
MVSPPELVPGTLLLDVSLSGLVGVGGRFFMGGDPADIFGEPGDALLKSCSMSSSTIRLPLPVKFPWTSFPCGEGGCQGWRRAKQHASEAARERSEYKRRRSLVRQCR